MAATYYVDPVNGNINNDGSSGSPWSTAEAVFNTKIGNPVTGGDTIYLRNGYHGLIYFRNYFANTSYITVDAEPGHEPHLRGMVLHQVNHLRFRNLRVSPELTPGPFSRLSYIINVDAGNPTPRSNDLVFENLTVYSAWDSSSWSAADWNNYDGHGFYTRCPNVTIRNCYIRNAKHGLTINGPYGLVEYNTIENFSMDGMQINASDTIVQYNVVKGAYDVSGNHDDMLQSVTLQAGEVFRNNIIRGNYFIARDFDETNPLVKTECQGVTGTSVGDHYEDWTIENNVVITSHRWGIAVSEGIRAHIINNTVFNPWTSNHTCISTSGGQDSIMRNNIAQDFVLGGTGLIVENNLDLDNYNHNDLFVNPSSYNLRLKEGSPAIDAGSAVDAPNIDIEGTTRPQGEGFDIGAFEYQVLNPDTTVPSVPQNLVAQAVSESRIDLSWDASSDPESGVSYYRIYRNGSQVDTSTSTSYSNTGLNSGTTYSYQVSAVNGQGLESGLSNTAQATTSADITPPSIVAVGASETSVVITFSEPLDSTSAEQTSNYSINNGISVIAALLDNDTVTLTTSAHIEGSYTLTVENVQDTSGNQMSETTRNYEYDNGLVAHWKFDDASGNIAMDSSGNNNTGTLINEPTWTTGKINGALNFDGTNQYVDIGAQDIPSPWTASLWVERQDSSNSNAALLDSANYSLKLEQYPNLNNTGFSIYGVADYTFNYQAPIGSWAHLVFVGTQNQVSLYADGALEDSVAASISCPMAQMSSISRAVNGKIDEVRVYNRALTTGEILVLYNEGTAPDTTPPVISNVQTSNVTTLQATITWSTNENSTSQIEYGLSTSYGNTTNLDSNLVASHSVLLTGLASETPYHYRVRSEDASGNESISQDNTFTTLGLTTYSITASASSGGTINPSGTTQVNSGGSQIYNITPNTGYYITNVLVDGSSVGAVTSYNFTNVTANHTITATFAINTYTITASAGSGGTISPIGTTQVNSGGTQIYTITPNAGYHIVNVLVDGSSIGAVTSYNFTNVTANHIIAATFAINSYTITANAGSNGQISPDGITQVNYGASQTYTITANAGYRISDVIVDGSSVGAVSNYPFTNVTANHTITASFAIDEQDVTAPTVTNPLPQADSIQVPLNTLITLDISDPGEGVDADSVTIQVNNDTVYSGNTDKYSSANGECYKQGTKANYTYTYQSNERFNFDETITVTANATDLAGNSMNEHSYSFQTRMRGFGKNKKVNINKTVNVQSTEAESLNNERPSTCCDSKGNIWVTWHTVTPNNQDIYIGKLATGEEYFGDSNNILNHPSDQRNPVIATGQDDKLYIVWQDNRRGNWDIYLSTSSDGTNWSTETRVTDSNDNQINPAIVVDSSNNTYIVWEDDRNSNRDIYVATSSNGFVTKTVSQITNDNSNQVEPAIAADSDNTVYIVWTDTRNSRNDIYGASSNNGLWTNVAIVNNTNNQSNPAIATEAVGSILHLVWVDDTPGDYDIFYAKTNGGLPASPLTGTSIIDDTTGADQVRPVIVVTGSSTGNNVQVFVCWEDKRNSDDDLYFAELGSGSGTNVFVDDDGTNSGQTGPAMNVDKDGYPYLVWTDNRNTNKDIYYAGSTSMESTVLASGNISTSSTTTVETADGVSVVVPAGAYPSELMITISEIKNPPTTSKEYLSLSYDFGPSGIEFDPPVTITIPYEVLSSDYSASAYWYNLLTAAPSQQGITDVETIVISSTPYLRFKTTHFTQFFVGGSSGSVNTGVSGGGGGGGCSMSVDSQASILDLLLPYLGLSITMIALKLKDKRKRKLRKITKR